MIDILIVEPDKVLGDTYARALQGAGYKVALSTDAQTAILSVDQQKPKLIILELQLAKHNGVEFLYELRSYPDWQKVPVIVLSSISQIESGIGQDIQKRLGILHHCYKSQTSLTKLIKIVKDIL